MTTFVDCDGRPKGRFTVFGGVLTPVRLIFAMFPPLTVTAVFISVATTGFPRLFDWSYARHINVI